jgi:hypothetical protein
MPGLGPAPSRVIPLGISRRGHLPQVRTHLSFTDPIASTVKFSGMAIVTWALPHEFKKLRPI